MIQHLALDVERFWFRQVMLGADIDSSELTGAEDDAWLVLPETTPQSVLDLYRRETALADEVISTVSLDAQPQWWPDFFGSFRMDSLREVILHVITETARPRSAADALRHGDLARVGELLVEGHASLRDDYESSCPEADTLVDLAVRHGAWGARLTGAGWGGAVIALIDPRRAPRVVAEVQERFRMVYGRTPEVWSTPASRGVRAHSA